jgi:hypothetical protein
LTLWETSQPEILLNKDSKVSKKPPSHKKKRQPSTAAIDAMTLINRRFSALDQ